ncbi:MAG: tetratricopeptide repeat protein [Candidatus Eremiobacterota bacterium]
MISELAGRVAEEGRVDEAVRLLESAVEREPELRLLLARLLRDVPGRAEDALRHLYSLVDRNPPDRIAVEFLIWTGLECGRPDVVAHALERLRDPRYADLVREAEVRLLADPDSSNLRFGVAFLMYRQGRYAEAAARFGRLTEDPRWGVWAWNMFGLCYSAEERFFPSVAIDAIRNALEKAGTPLPSDYLEIYFNLASAQYRDYRFREALATLRRLSMADSDYPHVDGWLREVRQLVRRGPHDDGDAACGALRKPPFGPWPSGASARESGHTPL